MAPVGVLKLRGPKRYSAGIQATICGYDCMYLATCHSPLFLAGRPEYDMRFWGKNMKMVSFDTAKRRQMAQSEILTRLNTGMDVLAYVATWHPA